MQEGMVFHALTDQHSSAYLEQFTFTVNGKLEISQFKESLQQLAAKYAILRTAFVTSGVKQALQVVGKQRDIEFTVADGRVKTVREYQELDKQRGFDLRHDPLMRVTIVQENDQRSHVLWSFHHILMDGWCLGIIIQEFFAIYRNLTSGTPLMLSPVQPFSSYIQWLEKQDKEQARAYWETFVSGYTEHAGLPKRSVRLQGDYVKQEHAFVLDAGMTQGLEQVARQHHVTLNTLIQTVWGLLLQKYNRSQDVVFGAVVSGRPAELPDVERMVGLFINTIPVRVTSGAEQRVSDLLRQVQEAALSSERHAFYPLYEIQSHSGLGQGLVDHIVVFENYPMTSEVGEAINSSDAYEFTVDDLEVSEQTNYNFNVIVVPGSELFLKFQYNSLVYDPQIVRNMEGHVKQIAAQLIEDAGRSHESIEIVTLDEHRWLEERNKTVAVYPYDNTIVDLFEEQVARTPEAVAVVCGDELLTYRELNERANRMARSLQSAGMTERNFVAIAMKHSEYAVIAILAVLKAGCAYIPIDPGFPEGRIVEIIQDSHSTLLITDDPVRFIGRLDCVILDTNDESNYLQENHNLNISIRPNDLAYMIYTSGSTGKSKGVMVEHRGLVNYIWWAGQTYIRGRDDAFALYSSLTFDLTVTSLFTPLVYGNKMIIFRDSGRDNLFNEIVSDTRVTILKMTPAHFALIKELEPNLLQESKLSTLIIGGEDLKVGICKEMTRLFGQNISIYNEYGPTETVVGCMIYRFDPERDMAGSVPIGLPINNMKTYILDEQLQPLPMGVTGELYIAGDGVANGYLNRPELTAEKFINNPFVPDERIYRTGDLARWLPDGNIEYLGRIDHQVKICGYRIECGEVETRLMEHEAVREAVVMSKSDQREQAYLCAYYVSSEALSVAELRTHLAALLPEYMIPAYFVQLNEIPLTPNGKVDRKAFPEPDYSFAMEQQAPPSNEYEVAVLDIWRDVIGRENIGMNRNFFEVGGNSISLIQVHARLNERFPDLLSIADLFGHPTIRQLARHIENLLGKERNTLQLSPIQFSEEVFTNGAYTPGDTVEFRLTELQVNYILRVSKQSGVDIESVLLALLIYLFSEYADTDQVSIACMTATDITVPIEIDLSSLSNLNELFYSVGEQKKNPGFRMNRSEWQYKRLERLRNELYAAFTTSKNASIELNRIFNLVVRVKQSGSSISLQWDYDSGKMQLHTIHSWIRSYSDLILSMTQYLGENEEIN